MQGHELEQFKIFNTFIAIKVSKLFQNVIRFYNLTWVTIILKLLITNKNDECKDLE